MSAAQDRAPRVIGATTNMASAAAAALAASGPATERSEILINDPYLAIEDLGNSVERVRALYERTSSDLGEIMDQMEPGPVRERIASIWLIFELANEKLEEADDTLGATINAFLAARDGQRVAA